MKKTKTGMSAALHWNPTLGLAHVSSKHLVYVAYAVVARATDMPFAQTDLYLDTFMCLILLLSTTKPSNVWQVFVWICCIRVKSCISLQGNLAALQFMHDRNDSLIGR